MAKKKTISIDEFLTIYMNFVENNKRAPKNFNSFVKRNNLDVDVAKEEFKNFKELDRYIFYRFFENTIELLEQSEEYHAFNAQNKLLSFYYTYFELLAANDPYARTILEKESHAWTHLSALKQFKKYFLKYIESLPIDTLDLYNTQLNKLQIQFLQSAGWIQFVSLLKFWLSDRSKAYEKTDIFIEKLVNTSFDLINIKPIKSVIDLGKFLVKEKTTKKI